MSVGSENLMEALVLHTIGDLRLERVPRPAPRAGEVLLRVAFSGVCGSDIPRIYSKGTYSYPLIPGHEFSGTVEALGEGVSSVVPGERVAVFPLIWCGACPACERGRYAQCSHYDYLGSRSNGAFAEYVVAPARNLLKVPEGVSLEEAAMAEPAAVALHALRKAGGNFVGGAAAVFGAGPVGLIVAQWARVLGASKIFVFDVVPERLELARRIGFELALDARAVDPASAIEEETGGEGAHVAVEAAGVPQTLIQALRAARRGGRVVILGNPSSDVTLPADLISRAMRRELEILGTWNSDFSAAGGDDDWRAALEAVRRGAIELEALVSHRVSLREALETLEKMRSGARGFSKVLVRPRET